ncbi:Pyoverdine/dityrosine biosynthesis protein-domain-containing protein [Paraphoma chrysanthemicola]|uniref:Pyoverdine/dityrosine biosynthesis protein-domain-containing protein n=1 Tax=Paraphoma chrysanthemicola TaxID=798071 RepID=A0A8K0RF26_9PLEO|nr:Pyoverdine/dityrosine biosynthesis protein-domain-containing protein [Paraphoma chrysanthemicola]
MPPLNKAIATYHSINALYWRNATGELLAIEGSNSKTFPAAWTQLKDIVCSTDGAWTSLELPSGKKIKTLQITATIEALQSIRSNFPPSYQQQELNTQVSEIEHDNGLTLGMVVSRPKSVKPDGFTIWAERFILLETEFQPFASIGTSNAPWERQHRETCEKIAEIFERRLKNVSKDDQWAHGGREIFLNRVFGYVDKNVPIQCALPAFPCKSPNPNKVGGIMPDLAEHIAMDVLHDFIKEVNTVYEPGATMWVINDGHVFSDCIGVDDEMIDTYDACMAAIFNQRFPNEDTPVPTIKFKGLKNIFAADSEGFRGLEKLLRDAHKMPHPVKTKLTGEAELCRKLMLGIGGPDRNYIRQLITEQEPDALGLYRGQTRFMLEDLADIPSVKSMSGKQKKKTAALVAEEMMSRNQAYSNLTELLLPNYVRLSIHAHNNAGPKFAVRLLPADRVRAIDCLETRLEPNPVYEFQLPTPWHNSMIKVEGDEYLYLARAQIARKALETPEYSGSWVEGPDGSYFSLKRKTGAATEEAAAPTKVNIPESTPAGKISVFNQQKKSTIVIVSPIAEKKNPIIICSPVVGKNPIIVNSPTVEGQRPIVICSPGKQSMFSPIAEKVRSPIGAPIARRKTSVFTNAEKGPTVSVSPMEPQGIRRQDTHFVQSKERNKLRSLLPVISMMRSLRGQS